MLRLATILTLLVVSSSASAHGTGGALGGALGILGVPLPATEIGIAASAIVLGLMVAIAAQPALWIASVLVGLFAIFHGYAHGAELPAGVDAVAYSVGFVVATGLLHLTGILFGL